MKIVSALLCTLCCAFLLSVAAPAQTHSAAGEPQEAHAAHPAAQGPSSFAPVARKIEAYLRNLFALGARFKIKVAEPKPTPIPGIRAVDVDISVEGQSNTLTLFVSDDGRYIIQGDLADMQIDPFVKIRGQMDFTSAPSHGPANAKVVVVEYADLQCPSCRLLSEVLRGIFPNYPQVRFVFREFPLTQIHVWSLTAAIGGRCVYHKDPAAFWPYSEYIFDHQDTITADNAWDTVVAQGVAAGFDADSFKACMADPAMKAEIDKSTDEGIALKVANTPTVFVNGRRLVGGNRDSLVQYIDYELARTGGAAKP